MGSPDQSRWKNKISKIRKNNSSIANREVENRRNWREMDYVSYSSAIAIVKECQPWSNPSDPDPLFANDLHYKVAEELGLLDQEEGISKLTYYTCIGTPLDIYHGVDCFLY